MGTGSEFRSQTTSAEKGLFCKDEEWYISKTRLLKIGDILNENDEAFEPSV